MTSSDTYYLVACSPLEEVERLVKKLKRRQELIGLMPEEFNFLRYGVLRLQKHEEYIRDQLRKVEK